MKYHQWLRSMCTLGLAVVIFPGCHPTLTRSVEPLASAASAPSPPSSSSTWSSPLDRTSERFKKITFGLYVDPTHTPLHPPERFTGYHTGLDFEIFADEGSRPVAVYSICEGKIIDRRSVSGYGGTVIQRCLWNQQPVTVLYGHLKLASVTTTVGQILKPGDKIGVLGRGQSVETSYTRKHLHLGIHQGPNIQLRGYVQHPQELKTYVDPAFVLGYR